MLILAGCSVPQGWGDDHLVLDKLQLLEDNEMWEVLWSPATQAASCNFVICQNVIGQQRYEIVGNVDEARAAALDELLQNWEYRTAEDRFCSDSDCVNFQLRDEVEINTTTGTAFLTMRFAEDFALSPDFVFDDAIVFTLTSDIDPSFSDMVWSGNNKTIALIATAGVIPLAVASVVLYRKTRRSPRVAS